MFLKKSKELKYHGYGCPLPMKLKSPRVPKKMFEDMFENIFNMDHEFFDSNNITT